MKNHFHTKHDPKFASSFKKDAGKDYNGVLKELIRRAEFDMAFPGNYFRHGTCYQGKFEAQSLLNRLGVEYDDHERPQCSLDFKHWSQTKNFVQEYTDQGVASCRAACKEMDYEYAEIDRVEKRASELLKKFGGLE